MRRERPALFKGRHFEPEIILLCVRRYLRYALSLRNLEEIMAVRNVDVDHVTIWRWIQRYAPELSRRCPRELRKTNGSWRVDETYLRVAGKWTYLYRAADSTGDTIDFLLSGSEQNQKTVAKAVQALLKNYPPHERAQDRRDVQPGPPASSQNRLTWKRLKMHAVRVTAHPPQLPEGIAVCSATSRIRIEHRASLLAQSEAA